MSQRTEAEGQYHQLCAEAKKRGGPFPNLVTKRIAEKDLYFFLVFVLNRPDARHDWVFDRCREVQAEPDGVLDLWARGHYKSTIITFAGILLEIARDRELTVGIFSFNRPAAKAFLRQIKRECETNSLLAELWPDVFWQDPGKDAPSWSEDAGLVVRRNSNPKEATVEAWGLVEGQPTGKHFQMLVYDDVVTKESVTTPEQIAKTTEGWELSLNVTAKNARFRYAGTRYHYDDTYKEIIDRGSAKARVHPCMDDDGEPVLLSKEALDIKRRDMGPTTFAAQMLLDPKVDSTVGFLESWLQFHDGIPAPSPTMNKYIVVDPANEKKKNSDYTFMWVIGLSSDQNIYALELLRDRLNLEERISHLFRLHRKWKPMKVGYERYGKDADISAIMMEQKRINYRFGITELAGRLTKGDRIRRLEPIFAAERLYLPPYQYYTNYDGHIVDLVQSFINEEYKPYPASRYDDGLDSLARLLDEDLGIVWPRPIDRTTPFNEVRRGSHWAQ